MKKIVLLALAVAFLGTAEAKAATIVLTFEGVGDNQPVGSFYDGVGGPDYNIVFGAESLGLISAAAGGSGDFSNNPSGDTVLYFLSGSAIMNVVDGFTTGFSFYYAAAAGGSVDVYDGLNGTGNLLASIALPITPDSYTVWVPIGVNFLGTARSVDFGGAANFIGFDDVTLGSSVPGTVPEPSTLVLLGLALTGMVARARRRVV